MPSTTSRRFLRPAALIGAAVLAASVAACGSADATPTATPSASAPASAPASAAAGVLTIRDPWVKAADKGMTAAFGTLVNDSDTDVTITGVTTDVSRAELHEMAMKDGKMVDAGTSRAASWSPARSQAALEPGGDHLMLMDLTRPGAPRRPARHHAHLRRRPHPDVHRRGEAVHRRPGVVRARTRRQPERHDRDHRTRPPDEPARPAHRRRGRRRGRAGRRRRARRRPFRRSRGTRRRTRSGGPRRQRCRAVPRRAPVRVSPPSRRRTPRSSRSRCARAPTGPRSGGCCGCSPTTPPGSPRAARRWPTPSRNWACCRPG